MGKKLSFEEIKGLYENENREILEIEKREYGNKGQFTTYVRYKCLIDGYCDWMSTSNMKAGKGCPKCAGKLKLTLGEVKIRLKEINPNIEILSDTYINNNTELKCRCLIDNHEWNANWGRLSQGTGCPKCAGTIKYTIDLLREKLINIGIVLDKSCVYKNIDSPIKCMDSEGYILYSSTYSILNSKNLHRLRFLEFNPYTLYNISHFIKIKGLSDNISLKDGQIYKNAKTDELVFICSEHGEFKSTWDNFKQKQRCKYCNMTYEIWDGNRLSTQRPDLIKYFENPIDADNVHTHSGFMQNLKCPACGTLRQMEAYRLASNGFICNNCSSFSKISTPERFMRSLLTYLNVNFCTQKVTDWSCDRRYDFFFEKDGKEYFCEVHGKHHYIESKTFTRRSLKEEQANDTFKLELYLLTGAELENYIVIDCRYSTLEWLKKNGIKELGHIFDLSDVNWNIVWQNTLTDVATDSIKLWNDGIRNSYEIAKILKIGRSSVNKHLKNGASVGMCDYDPLIVMQENARRCGRNNKKPVNGYKNDILIYSFDSAKSAGETLNISIQGVSNCCNGKTLSSGGYVWKCADGLIREE